MTKNYTLFLDESETHDNHKHYFCIAGVIIADDDYSSVQHDIDSLKSIIWNDLSSPQNVILHQMRISEAEKGRLDTRNYPEYNRFRSMSTRQKFYNEFKKVFVNNSITLVGGSLYTEDLMTFYSCNSSGHNTNITDKYLVCLQLLLENYCHFLCTNNGLGKIIYETRETKGDEQLRNRFYHIKLMGSMFIDRTTMDKRLLGMDFVSKESNNVGLQIADFIPNAFARDHAGFARQRPNIFSTLAYHRYDGNVGKQERFGIKYMP